MSDMGTLKDFRQPRAKGAPVVAFDFDGTLTIRDSFTAFLRWRAGAGAWALGLVRMAPAVAAYARDVTGYLSFLALHRGGAEGTTALTSLTASDLRAWMAHERGRGLSARSLARALSAVKTFTRWLADRPRRWFASRLPVPRCAPGCQPPPERRQHSPGRSFAPLAWRSR